MMAKRRVTLLTVVPWLFPFFIFVLIFYPVLFQPVFLVDYAPRLYVNPIKDLQMGNFSWLHAGDILDWLLSSFRLSGIFFQIAFLSSLYVSFYFIRKLQKHYMLSFLIFVFNPFVYSRLMVGQIWVVVSYLLLPMYLHYIVQALSSKNSRASWMKAAVAAAVISTFSPHMMFFLLVIMGVAFFWFVRGTVGFQWKDQLKSVCVFILLLMMLNAYWLQAVLSPSIALPSISAGHKYFFSPTLSQDLPAVAKIIGMWGFWREDGFVTFYESVPRFVYYALVGCLLLLLLLGYMKSNDPTGRTMLSLWWIGVVLATGVSHPFTAPFFDFLFNHLPFFSGFRDSHKLVVFIAMGYAFLCPCVLDVKGREGSKKQAIMRAGVYAFIVVLILVFTFPLIGFGHQIKSAWYPSSYVSAAEFLNEQPLEGYTIYLPWQTYLTYTWTKGTSPDGRIPAPINHVVKRSVTLGPDIWGSVDSFQNTIGACIQNRSVSCLERSGVRYVLKDRCAYFPDRYDWLNRTVIHDNGCLTIIKLEPLILNGPQEQKLPVRFVIGSLISLGALLLIINQLYGKNP